MNKQIAPFFYSLRKGFFKQRPSQLEHVIPWAFITKEGIVVNKDNSMFLTASIVGPDLESSIDVELIQYISQLNNVFKRLGTGFVIYFENQRLLSNQYIASTMPTALQQSMEDARADYFNNSGQHFENHYFLTLYYTPPSKTKSLLTKAFIEEGKAKAEGYSFKNDTFDKIKGEFQETARQFFLLLDNYFKQSHILTPDEMVTYLHSTISDKRQPVVVSPYQYLTDYLVDVGIYTRTKPKLGESFMKVITLLSFPHESYPGILDQLNELSCEYRWVSRYICLSKNDAEKEDKNIRKNWDQQRYSPFELMKETLTNSPTRIPDQEAMNLAQDAHEALAELQTDFVSQGYYTLSIVMLNKDPKQLEEDVHKVRAVITSKGFTCKDEDFHAYEMWSASIIGLHKAGIRRHLLNSLNFCHLAPTSSIWSGDEWNEHLKGPVLLYTDTRGSTPFRLSLHQGSLAHTLVVGPSGSGKSVLLNMMEAHFGKYEGSYVFVFDKAGSSKALTYGVEGNFYNLSVEMNELSFQPFAHIETISNSHLDHDEVKESNPELTWAYDWVLSYLKEREFKLDEVRKNLIFDALRSLSLLPQEERTVSMLRELIQDREIRNALQPLTHKGPYGKLFDSNVDRFGQGRWQVFEMEKLMRQPEVVASTLRYLFHRIEGIIEQAKEAPAMIVIDECWLFLKDPLFQEKLDEYFRDMRKKNTTIVLATQNISDVMEYKALTNTILNNCPNRIYLANPLAVTSGNLECYKQFGLNDQQIQIIANMERQHEYYYTSHERGNRVFSLAIQPVEQYFVFTPTKEDHRMIDYILETKGKKAFPYEWIAYKKGQRL